MIYKFYDIKGLLRDKEIYNRKENTKYITTTDNRINILYDFKFKTLPDEVETWNFNYFLNNNTYNLKLFPQQIIQQPEILAAAMYDYYIHPDETIFVTGSPLRAEIANLYFGEDSIIYVPETL